MYCGVTSHENYFGMMGGNLDADINRLVNRINRPVNCHISRLTSTENTRLTRRNLAIGTNKPTYHIAPLHSGPLTLPARAMNSKPMLAAGYSSL
jgi:hypothetical protein